MVLRIAQVKSLRAQRLQRWVDGPVTQGGNIPIKTDREVLVSQGAGSNEVKPSELISSWSKPTFPHVVEMGAAENDTSLPASFLARGPKFYNPTLGLFQWPFSHHLWG